MNIQDIYKQNKVNLVFSDNIKVEQFRKELLLNFVKDSYDKKNNESIKNVNLKNFFDFEYKYFVSKELSLIKKNQSNSYHITVVNGQCDNYKDEQIEIQKLSLEENNNFLNNNLIEKNDHFVNLNSLFLNSGFQIIIKKNSNIKIKISNIVSDENLTIFQKNFIKCEENSSIKLIEEYESNNNSMSNVLNVINI